LTEIIYGWLSGGKKGLSLLLRTLENKEQ